MVAILREKIIYLIFLFIDQSYVLLKGSIIVNWIYDELGNSQMEILEGQGEKPPK